MTRDAQEFVEVMEYEGFNLANEYGNILSFDKPPIGIMPMHLLHVQDIVDDMGFVASIKERNGLYIEVIIYG